jgi:hypothetical protein
MSIDPGTVDLGSMSALRQAFLSAPDPTLADLVGTHEGEFIGPGWLRAAGPVMTRLGRMPGWCGKRFAPAEGGPTEGGTADLVGVNLVRSGGQVSDSVPIKAAIGPSRLDGRPALIVVYPVDAPFPWPRVTDELRPFGDGVLLGMTFGIPASPPHGAPFLLRRTG